MYTYMYIHITYIYIYIYIYLFIFIFIFIHIHIPDRQWLPTELITIMGGDAGIEVNPVPLRKRPTSPTKECMDPEYGPLLPSKGSHGPRLRRWSIMVSGWVYRDPNKGPILADIESTPRTVSLQKTRLIYDGGLTAF